MTMPHLMNCAHADSGWCLDCVIQLHDYADALNARCVADTPDAERYRKWRADYTNNESTDMLIELADAWNPAQVDAAIDAALAVGAA